MRCSRSPFRQRSATGAPVRRPGSGRWPARRTRGSGRAGGGRTEGSSLLVLAELLAHDAADLAERGVRLQRGADRVQQVAAALCHLAQLLELRVQLVLVAALLELLEARDLFVLGLRVHAQDVDLVLGLGGGLIND